MYYSFVIGFGLRFAVVGVALKFLLVAVGVFGDLRGRLFPTLGVTVTFDSTLVITFVFSFGGLFLVNTVRVCF